jgi:hypothetical protein
VLEVTILLVVVALMVMGLCNIIHRRSRTALTISETKRTALTTPESKNWKS